MIKKIISSAPLILTTFAIFVSIGQQISAEKLNVLVLYESLCPDSIRFMLQQLGPSFVELKDYIDIKLVPFGKSESKNNGEEFFCQHGPSECLRNRQQSCVLNQTADQLTQVRFVVCQMSMSNNPSIEYCAENAGLSKYIADCLDTDVGTLLQLDAERITHSYGISFVPTIIYDGVFDQQLQDSSLRDFRGTVCGLLKKRAALSLHDTVCQK